MILIGLAGAAGSGKNYVADQIVAKYESVRQLAFADPLKQVVHHMFGIPLEDCYTEAGKNKPTWVKWHDVRIWCDECRNDQHWPHKPEDRMTVRDLLQWVGTDLVRYNWSENHWVSLAEQRIRNTPESVVVVTDVRFENEANLIAAMGGTTIRVVGRQAANTPSHASETGQFYVAGYVQNPTGTTPVSIMEQVEGLVHGLNRERVR